jgi:ferredoxin
MAEAAGTAADGTAAAGGAGGDAGRPAWRVRVSDACIGSGSCVGIAPDRFVPGPDGRSRPAADRAEPDDSVLDAAASCPVEAITIEDARTGALIDP